MSGMIKTYSPVVQNAIGEISDEFKAAFDLNFDISERIYCILKEKGISQRELASKLGKRESEVSKWLSGRHNFTIATISKISSAVGEDIINIPK